MNKTTTLFFFIGTLVLMLASCTKDEPKPTVSDVDGNIYHIVTIGTQTWLVENLKTTKYRNGDLIGTTSPATKNISSEITPKYQWAYNGDEINVSKYGRLYTWYAVTDTRNIAPIGWHVATDEEWTTLGNYMYANLGTSVSVAKALASTTDWTTYSTPGTIGNNQAINNYSGFSALPGGSRVNYNKFAGVFSSAGDNCILWCSTEYSTTNAWARNLYYSGSTLDRLYGSAKSTGYSVRCVKDSN